MRDDESTKNVSGEILPPEGSRGVSSQVQLQIGLPPEVAGMGLRRAILGQMPYWGARRTIEAYRLAVQAKVGAVTTVEEFYRAMRGLEVEKERLRQIDKYTEAARNEAEAFVERSLAALEDARRDHERARRELAEEQRRLAEIEATPLNKELIRLIAENNLKAELAKAELARAEAEQKLVDQQQGGGDGSYRQMKRQMERRRRDYEEMMADKAKDIEQYGSEEDFPEHLVEMYEMLEEALAFNRK